MIKKFKLPRGADPLQKELRPAFAWTVMVVVGAIAFFAVFLWAYFYFVKVAGLEDRAKSESAAEVLRVVDQADLHQAITLIEKKEMVLASSTPATIVDPSQ